MQVNVSGGSGECTCLRLEYASPLRKAASAAPHGTSDKMQAASGKDNTEQPSCSPRKAACMDVAVATGLASEQSLWAQSLGRSETVQRVGKRARLDPGVLVSRPLRGTPKRRAQPRATPCSPGTAARAVHTMRRQTEPREGAAEEKSAVQSLQDS